MFYWTPSFQSLLFCWTEEGGKKQNIWEKPFGRNKLPCQCAQEPSSLCVPSFFTESRTTFFLTFANSVSVPFFFCLKKFSVLSPFTVFEIVNSHYRFNTLLFLVVCSFFLKVCFLFPQNEYNLFEQILTVF